MDGINYVNEPFVRPGGSELDRSGSGFCTVRAFGFIDVEASGCTKKSFSSSVSW